MQPGSKPLEMLDPHIGKLTAYKREWNYEDKAAPTFESLNAKKCTIEELGLDPLDSKDTTEGSSELLVPEESKTSSEDSNDADANTDSASGEDDSPADEEAAEPADST